MLAAFADDDDLADLSLAELKAYGDELTKGIIDTRPPIKIASFEC